MRSGLVLMFSIGAFFFASSVTPKRLRARAAPPARRAAASPAPATAGISPVAARALAEARAAAEQARKAARAAQAELARARRALEAAAKRAADRRRAESARRAATTRQNARTRAVPKSALRDIRFRFRPGKGFEMATHDGRFRMVTRLRAQFRYVLENDEAADLTEHAFMIRRARLQFIGNLFGKHNQYKLEIAMSPKDVGLKDAVTQSPVLTWYMNFSQLRDLTVRIGQYKVPYSRERVISSGNLQMVDRSLTNGEFTVDRDLGFDIRSKNFLGQDWLRYYAGVYVGEGRDSYSMEDFGLMYLVRLEVLPLGMFKDYHEGALHRRRNRKPRLSIGLAYAYIDRAKRDRGIKGDAPADGGTTDTHNATVDLQFKWRGLSVLGAFFYRKGTRNPGDAVDENGLLIPVAAPRDGFGAFAQIGYLVPKIPFDFAARYGAIIPAGNGSALGRRSEIGLSLGYYFAGHPFKLQMDFFRYWDSDRIGTGINELRVQLQAAF